ncbi:L-2-hydroxyglutarate oxidase [Vibrio fluvialis]|jgi:L-2-hydroxyglutarate oxidase|uniref:L-2-hydroxyglutarate oxidase n=1 Tax=Vibrio fluvialis TaxID=676 RepID=UPI0012AD8E81|nr:L-2-hydroxyglutarate oxidase [Vibrio fluvialis]HDM8035329.1 L-2-hydroxyglutarate oxidase [Vibrio fluvialis clinical-1]EKO3411285.1 L-2-hydroxyglutarate oxidase [Vibrio fluvialis]EKO3419845.1 L-2-hydroxyglutarate oxidase [Vibrio fluvialis]EKO3520392.1 L-2-hydroxyglutarate oxidase [Vibrio fluvialis]EKO3527745.1 L-2-hydroxyglutarate oxidase [Vibrio fluvialis]
MNTHFDYVIVGGGIVGVSTAWQLKQQYPDKSILLVEKEAGFSRHQTGHNSGVIHAGVYYAPGSLKADFCKRGVERTLSFCAKHDIPVENCGKLLVATNEVEFERMQALFERCLQNELDVELLDAAQLKLAEPNITGLGAIYVKATSIVNYRLVTEKMAEEFKALGGEVCLSTEVVGLNETEQEISVQCRYKGSPITFHSQFLVSCSGLMADRMTKMLGLATDFQIIPYRGEYYRLAPKHNQVVKHLIYPIPDPELPFLGVHLTRMIDGSVTVGPNAVQGFKREGYGKVNISVRDVWEMLSFSGFWKVTAKNLKTGLVEMKNSLWKPGYLQLVRKYCPSIELADLQPYPAGIRAQAVLSDGTLVHDFLFAESPRSLHVCNAPSPAATSAMPIGEYICQKIAAKAPPEHSQAA